MGNTKMGSVQEHTNEAGPECFKCGQVCKDNSNLRNHVLSHYYRIFDPLIPQAKPFPCPECDKPSRDKITMIRHFAFTHGKLFELTEVTPAHLITAGGTPRKKREKKVEEGAEQEETGEKKTEEEKTESEMNGTDAAANEDKEEEEKKDENGKEEDSTASAERNATPAPMIEKAEEVRQICEVDDCKAPIIDNSSSESEEEEGGAVKVRLDKDSTRFLYAWLNSRLEHPFPSLEQTAALASESGLTVKQVEAWFRKKRKAMAVPEIEKKEEKKKETPKKKGKKKGKKKSESEEEEEEDEGADYVVEAVLERKVVTGKRGKSHKTLYLVKWLGWDREEDLTWEPLEHLQDPDGTCQALEIFEKKEKEKERLAKEKAEREETSIATSTIATSTGGEGRQGDESDPICLSSSPVPQEVPSSYSVDRQAENSNGRSSKQSSPVTSQPNSDQGAKVAKRKICSVEIIESSDDEESSQPAPTSPSSPRQNKEEVAYISSPERARARAEVMEDTSSEEDEKEKEVEELDPYDE